MFNAFKYLLFSLIVQNPVMVASIHHYSQGVYDPDIIVELHKEIMSNAAKQFNAQIELVPYPSFPSGSLTQLELNCSSELDFCLETHSYIVKDEIFVHVLFVSEDFGNEEFVINRNEIKGILCN